MSGQMNQPQQQPVVYLPQPAPAQPAAASGILPTFPTMASMIEGYAVKLPWYFWAVAGFYLAFRLFKRG